MKPSNLRNPPARRNKYNAVATVVDGIRFDSKAEARFYESLKGMVLAGQLKYFLRQVPFDLPGNVKYKCDFMMVYHNGKVAYVDVKGRRTPMYILKKKQVESLYPVEIQEV